MEKNFKITQIPSLIDMHVHFREPGFEYKETIETGIKSARAGGFSGVCTMPNTNPVTDNPKIIKEILGENCIAIHHIGSTSIVGLDAKPIIDIMPVVESLDAVDAVASEFEKIGYV